MHTHTMPSRLVKIFTNYEYSHVGISLDKECNNIYSFGRKKLNSILNGGFVVEKKDGLFFRKFNKTECKIYELEVTNSQYKDLKKNGIIYAGYFECRYRHWYIHHPAGFQPDHHGKHHRVLHRPPDLHCG